MILATHQTDLLENVEKILMMEDGRIIHTGAFDKVNPTKINFYEDQEENESSVYLDSHAPIYSDYMMLDDFKLKFISTVSKTNNEATFAPYKDKLHLRNTIMSSSDNDGLVCDQKYIDKPVQVKDWFKLFSFGVGN